MIEGNDLLCSRPQVQVAMSVPSFVVNSSSAARNVSRIAWPRSRWNQPAGSRTNNREAMPTTLVATNGAGVTVGPDQTFRTGQSFASAFGNLYTEVAGGQPVTTQPFFEAALGGASSPFCVPWESPAGGWR